METLKTYFDVQTIFFTIFGYEMSFLEFFGTILNIISVWLVIKNKIWTWPIGNVAVILFAILFYQIQLYSDLFEQIYFFIAGFYGWFVWLKLRSGENNNSEDLGITSSSPKTLGIYFVAIGLGTLLMGHLMSNIHLYLSTYFPVPATFAYLDAFTTVLSFAATILMAHKKIECWYLWILVDVIGIGLYFSKGVIFISILYVIFLVLAIRGLLSWNELYKKGGVLLGERNI